MKFLTSGKRCKPHDLGVIAPERREFAPSPAPGFAASALSAPMHDAFYLDDDLLKGQRLGLETLRARTLRARAARRGVQQRDAAQTLAGLGGAEPDLQTPGRGAFRGAR